jgi:hypothetical protein
LGIRIALPYVVLGRQVLTILAWVIVCIASYIEEWVALVVPVVVDGIVPFVGDEKKCIYHRE